MLNMEAIVEINNEVYNRKGHTWWDDSEDGTLAVRNESGAGSG